MPLKHLSCLLFFTLFVRLTALAATFIVTSNADSGPGTLREAITMANANGSTLTDTIVFNIADVSEAGRTIIPMSELPNLSSKIIIDGSTQPGSVFGISSAKIIIYLDHFTSSSFTFLSLRNASDVQVYGLCFKYFDNPDAGGGLHYGILLQNSSNIIIGSPGKGNLFSAVRISITNNHWNPVNNAVDNITIQGNVFGLGTTGQLSRRGSIYLMRAGNITIGGTTPAEGNVFVAASVYVSQDNITTMPFLQKFKTISST
jgi:hypothetical protein